MKRAFAIAAGVSIGVLVGMGVHEALDRYVFNDQRPPEYKPAWKRSTA